MLSHFSCAQSSTPSGHYSSTLLSEILDIPWTYALQLLFLVCLLWAGLINIKLVAFAALIAKRHILGGLEGELCELDTLYFACIFSRQSTSENKKMSDFSQLICVLSVTCLHNKHIYEKDFSDDCLWAERVPFQLYFCFQCYACCDAFRNIKGSECWTTETQLLLLEFLVFLRIDA